ncbi:MAG: thiamine pyrophosphate-dependent enzyme, partial [Dehalococcoidales bacterium]|nr:thiamine pyrophosphate-dependent enzyme [Dehalococcoidales bacterium]
AFRAARGGVLALASMKHVGLNVAADPFFSASYTGVKGGLVVITADDPGAHSSQNEQDNRHYARAAKVPLLEPADSQEAFDFTRLAFEISEQFGTPVLVRTTTRVAHSRSVVEIVGERPAPRAAKFDHNPQQWVMIPAHARLRHPLVEARQRQIATYAEESPLNRIERGDDELGIVTSGVAYEYAREVFPNASILKLGLSYPLPEGLVRSFAASVKQLLVVEELDPFLEEQLRALGLPAEGKSIFPILGEFSLDVVRESARKVGLLDDGAGDLPVVPSVPLPPRPPVLCPGCTHRPAFYALSLLGRRQAKKDGTSGQPKMVIAGDIGCYTLGVLPPLQALDTCVSMGSGIGMAVGLEKAGVEEKVVAVIGDSTFLHSGMTALLDAVYNGSSITVLVLDNGITAMTGHQDHPGTGVSAKGVPTRAVDIAEVVRALGVDDVQVVNAYDLPALRKSLQGAIERPLPSVVIARGLCALRNREKGEPLRVQQGKCNTCGLCLRVGCPAISQRDGRIEIDPGLCVGSVCGLCAQVCSHDAIAVQGV